MFCNKCGKSNPSGATFCNSCGNTLNTLSISKSDSSSNDEFDIKKPLDFKKIIKITILSTLALILLFSLIRCFNNYTAENALKSYLDGYIYGKNPKNYMEASLDPIEIEYGIDNGYYYSKSDILDSYTDSCEQQKEKYEDLEDEYNFSVSYKITSSQKHSKEEIKSIGELYEEEYGEYGYNVRDIEDAITFYVKFTKEADHKDYTHTKELTVVKIKGKWCICRLDTNYFSLYELFYF